MARIPVPDGLSVIGVDDDPHICENTKPPLSSIRPDYDQAGYTAASMLDEMIGGAKSRMEFFGAKSLLKNKLNTIRRIGEEAVL